MAILAMSNHGRDARATLAGAMAILAMPKHGQDARATKKELRRGPGWSPPQGIALSQLREQLQDNLLILVGLGQRGNARLFQHLELGHVGDHLPHIRVLDAAE